MTNTTLHSDRTSSEADQEDEKKTEEERVISSTDNLYYHAKNLLYDIQDILEGIDVNTIIGYVRYIIAALLISISIFIVLRTSVFYGK